MCGIAGIWNKSGAPVNSSELEGMGATLRHRGPDAGGVWQQGSLGFVHRRLKIIDLSDAANQPFGDGRSILVFNGEIFNFRELREELCGSHEFRTSSDTEVLFAALREWGTEAFSRLEGQFALGWFDQQRQTMVLARDHVGICPLYVFEDESSVIFSSEIKPILRLRQGRIDPRGLMDYLGFRYNIQNGVTLFQGVRRLAPAHFEEYGLRDGNLRRARYWRLPKHDLRPTANQEDLNRALDREIRQQSVADVPVGLYLSGGIDSGAILHGFSKARNTVRSFTIGFGEDDPEVERVRTLYGQYGFSGEVFQFGADCFTDPEETLLALEEPFGDLIIGVNHFLAAQASRELRVVLSGEGGDESFFGYDHQRGFSKMLAWGRAPLLRRLGKILISSLSTSFLGQATTYPGGFGDSEKKRVTQVFSLMGAPDEAFLTMVRLFDNDEIQRILTPRFREMCPGSPDTETIREAFLQDSVPWQGALRAEIEQLTLIVNLLKQERFSMFYSMESRVPLVGRRILELLGSLPESFFLGPINKRCLLDYTGASKPLRKQAFSVFSHQEYKGVLEGLIKKYVSEEAVRDGGVFTWEEVSPIIRGVKGRGFLDEKKRMAILVFHIWQKAFQLF